MNNESGGTPNPLNPGVGSMPSGTNLSEPIEPVFDEARISKIRETVTPITLDSPIGPMEDLKTFDSQTKPVRKPSKISRPQKDLPEQPRNRAMDFVRPTKKVDSGRMDIVNSRKPQVARPFKKSPQTDELDDYYKSGEFKGFRQPKASQELKVFKEPEETREIISPPLNDSNVKAASVGRITVNDVSEPEKATPERISRATKEPRDTEMATGPEAKKNPETKELEKPTTAEKEPASAEAQDFVPVTDFRPQNNSQALGGSLPTAPLMNTVGSIRGINNSGSSGATATVNGQTVGGLNNTADPSHQMGVITNLDGSLPAQNLSDPMKRPMKQAAMPEPPKPKKKHTGLIIGMIISVFLAVGCGVAAALILANNKPDPVAEAINRIVDGNSPKNTVFDGAAKIAISDKTLPIAEMTINIKGEGEFSSLLNSTTVNLNASMRNGGTFSLEMGEVYAANGDLYLMLSGANNVLSDPYLLPSLAGQKTTCEGQENCPSGTAATEGAVPAEGATPSENTTPAETPTETDPAKQNPENSSQGASTQEITTATESNSMLQVLIKTLQAMQPTDGKWVRMSANEINKVLPETLTEEHSIQCMSGFVNDLRENSNSITKLYKANPFIVASKQASQVKSEQNPIYRVVVEDEKFSNFMYAAKDQTVVRNLTSCLGYDEKILDVDKILQDMRNWPEFYTEIDENYNFTRLYIASNLKSSDYCETGKACTDRTIGTAVLDLDFSYPATINVSEPTEYVNASEL